MKVRGNCFAWFSIYSNSILGLVFKIVVSEKGTKEKESNGRKKTPHNHLWVVRYRQNVEHVHRPKNSYLTSNCACF